MIENLKTQKTEQAVMPTMELDEMRRFIVKTAQEIQNPRLLEMLYIRAKTLRNM